MRFSAVSIGEAVKVERLDGVVHSVFESALNIRLTDGTLISVLSQQHGNQPRGIRIDAPEGFQFDEQGIRAGDAAASRAGVLRFAAGGLAIGLRGATVWKADLFASQIDFRRETSRDGWRVMVGLLDSCPAAERGIGRAALGAAGMGRHSAATPFESRTHESIGKLIEATRGFDIGGASEVAARLVGAGPGLTPSGDDFLAGFMAALWVSGRGDEERTGFAGQFGERLAGQLGRTTDISRGFVSDAIRQMAPETTIRLIEAIAGVGDVRRAAGDALAVGNTSGADSVAGVAVGLIAWQQEWLAIPALQF